MGDSAAGRSGRIGRMNVPTGTDGAAADDLAAAKAALRALALAARRDLVARQGEPGRRTQAEQLADRALEWLRGYLGRDVRDAPGGWTVTAYAQRRTEPPVDLLVHRLVLAGVRVLLPHTLGDGLLDWYDASDPGQVAMGTGVLAGVDVAFVPGLAVDRRGVRLGKGGGYYDRALPLLPARTPTITVLHDDELVEDLPAGPHDVRVWGTLTAGHGVRPTEHWPQEPR
jgi:5-formyltetrahydrofolate cyclo-ligase